MTPCCYICNEPLTPAEHYFCNVCEPAPLDDDASEIELDDPCLDDEELTW